MAERWPPWRSSHKAHFHLSYFHFLLIALIVCIWCIGKIFARRSQRVTLVNMAGSYKVNPTCFISLMVLKTYCFNTTSLSNCFFHLHEWPKNRDSTMNCEWDCIGMFILTVWERTYLCCWCYLMEAHLKGKSLIFLGWEKAALWQYWTFLDSYESIFSFPPYIA